VRGISSYITNTIERDWTSSYEHEKERYMH
jgi:hypothetical protein